MFKAIRRFIAERKYPPQWTADRCTTCGQCFHNREHLFIIGSKAYHATIDCIWRNVPVEKRRRASRLSSVPYLEAKGLVEPGTFD